MQSRLVVLLLVQVLLIPAYSWGWKQALSAAVIGLRLPLMTIVDSVEIPSDKDNNLVRMAFKDFDEKRFGAAEAEFTLSIDRWKEMHRPRYLPKHHSLTRTLSLLLTHTRDEIVSLLISRGNVYLDNKKFESALSDFNSAIELMKPDGEKPDGTANYPEFVSAFVDRGLVYEGLGKWSESLDDYNKAVTLWGGGRGDNINPFVLSYRGNVLTRLNRFEEAILDYDASSKLFLDQRDIDRYSDARSNYALALYQIGDTDAAVKAMKGITNTLALSSHAVTSHLTISAL